MNTSSMLLTNWQSLDGKTSIDLNGGSFQDQVLNHCFVAVYGPAPDDSFTLFCGFSMTPLQGELPPVKPDSVPTASNLILKEMNKETLFKQSCKMFNEKNPKFSVGQCLSQFRKQFDLIKTYRDQSTPAH